MAVLERERIVDALGAFLAQYPEVRFAYLYGSRALGFERPDSDVDVAAYFDANGDIAPEMTLQDRLSNELALPVVVVNLNERPAANFFKKVLPKAIVIKDSPDRAGWEEGRGVMSSEDRGTIEDYLLVTLEAMSEKNVVLREDLPSLEKVDLDLVKRGNKDAIYYFLGIFMAVFQPLESLARRMANYLHWTARQDEPKEFRDQIKLLGAQLGLDDAAIATLDKFAKVRNKVAHAYWNLKEDELSNSDLRDGHRILEELTRRVDAFVASARSDVATLGSAKNQTDERR